MADEMINERSWNEMFDSTWKKEDRIEFLLYDAGLDVNALNKHGRTMLSYAAEWGNIQMVEFLGLKGADGNSKNSDGSKPLHFAAKFGRKNIVKYFLGRGVSANSCDNNECTPLHYVADVPQRNIPPESRERYQEVAHFLMDSDADLDFVNRNGVTPVLLAAQSHRLHLIELFVRLGANLEIYDEDGYSVLHFAAFFGWSGTVRYIVEGQFDFDLDARTSSGETPLIFAARKSHRDIVELLIDSGANVDFCCARGYTVLHHSCCHGWLDIVKHLVSMGCDINAESIDECTPLDKAFVSNHPSTVKYLLDSGANLNFGDSDLALEDNILHHACENGWMEIVKFLIKKGCDLDAQGDWDGTPLQTAVNNGKFEIASLLLQAGANGNLGNLSGNTAFNDCIHLSHVKGIMLFIENGAYVQPKDYKAIVKDHSLKEAILQDTNVCTQAIINRFNNADLPRIYETCARIPSLTDLKIASGGGVAQDIAKSVQFEIETKGYCDLLKARPIVLRMMCVRSFLDYKINSLVPKSQSD